MISKKLLSEVLGLNVLAFEKELNCEVYYLFDESCGNLISREAKINIYELANLCKEWIANKYPRFSIKWDIGYVKGTNEVVKVWLYDKCIGQNRQEHKAIFQACEWILNELKGD